MLLIQPGGLILAEIFPLSSGGVVNTRVHSLVSTNRAPLPLWPIPRFLDRGTALWPPMRRTLHFFVVCLSFAWVPFVAHSARATAPAEGTPAAERVPAPSSSNPRNELTVRLLNVLRAEPGNVFFSAVSLRDALGMAALGAKGSTLDEMVRALQLEPDPSKNVAAAKQELAEWRRAAGRAELAIANRVWADATFRINPAFQAQTRAGYGASAQALDFSNAPEPSRKTMNQWVSAKTRGKIPESFSAGSVKRSTRLVVTNAIYFKGRWSACKRPFVLARTFQPWASPERSRFVSVT